MFNHRKSEIDNALQAISDSLGIDIVRHYHSNNQGNELTIRLHELPEPHGFALKVNDDYLQWRIVFNLDTFSKPLVELLSKRYFERRESFQTYIDLAKEHNQKFLFRVNGQDISEINGTQWDEVEIEIAKSYFSTDEEYKSLTSLLLDFMCLVLFLLVDEIEWSEENNYGAYEGELISATINKYERSRYNRAICLRHFGFKCRGCGELLEEKYGPIGAEVIHVHHIIPVSQMGGSYKLNPIRDLIPLCPNCHNIVHRINPPLEIGELHKLTGMV